MGEMNQKFHLNLGDFMYADHPMWFGDKKSAFEVHYRDVFHDESYSKFSKKVPVFFMYDVRIPSLQFRLWSLTFLDFPKDHEIFDNWDDGGADGGASNTQYTNAMAAYKEYNEGTNPPPLRSGSHYFTFSAGMADFFIVDTRQYRSHSDEADGPTHTMLGATQLQDLKNWLSSTTATFKFVGSSVPFALHSKSSDCWYGYKRERDEILDYIETNNIPGVTFLSGDRHWAGIFELRPGIFEFSVSPIVRSNYSPCDIDLLSICYGRMPSLMKLLPNNRIQLWLQNKSFGRQASKIWVADWLCVDKLLDRVSVFLKTSLLVWRSRN